MKKIYASPWFLLAIAALVVTFTGVLNAATLIVFSLIALALFGRSTSAQRVRC